MWRMPLRDPWYVRFEYFDKTTTSYGHSKPQSYDSREEAVRAAQNAQSHNGGGIVVTRAQAYPKSLWWRRSRTQTFAFQSRYANALTLL